MKKEKPVPERTEVPDPRIIHVNAQKLPYTQISWEAFEILCQRLAKTQVQIEEVRPYGKAGDKQHGIDIYAVDASGNYHTYQCKNVKKFGPAKIIEAVNEFLAGDWAKSSKTFVLCSAQALFSQLQEDEIVRQRKRLSDLGIDFKVWDSTGLDTLMKDQPQLVMDFFREQVCREFIGEERMAEVIIPRPLPSRQPSAAPDRYIARTVRSDGEDMFSTFWGDGKTLIEVIEQHRHIALLAWGQDGKSTELEYVASELSKPDSPWYPLLFRMKMHGVSDIDTLFPEFANIPQDKVVMLLDGLDEVLNSVFDQTAKKILEFAAKYPKARIVVSCRTNFYTTDNNVSGVSTLINFKSYSLAPISDAEMKRFISDQLGAGKDAFWKAVTDQAIESQLVKPSYLIRMVEQFALHKKINSGKAALYNDEVLGLIDLDIRRSGLHEQELLRARSFGLLGKLAFVLLSTNQPNIGESEIERVFPDPKDRTLLKLLASTIVLSDIEKRWSFISLAIQEYFAATVLEKLPMGQLKGVTVSNTGSRRVSRIWANSLLFLTSKLKNTDEKKSKIFKWLRRDNLELLVLLQVQDIAEGPRFELFRSVMKRLETEDRRFMIDGYRPQELARFSQCEKTLAFVVEKLKSGAKNSLQANLLELTVHFELGKFPDYRKSIIAEVGKIILSPNAANTYLALIALSAMGRISAEDFAPIFLMHHNSKDTWIRYALFQSIHVNQLTEHYVQFVLDQCLALINDNRINRGKNDKPMRLSNEFTELGVCLSNVNSAKGLGMIIGFLRVDNRFAAFCYDPSFKKSIESIFAKIIEHAGDNGLSSEVYGLFIDQHTYVLHEDSIGKYFLSFFQKAGLVGKLFAELYAKMNAGGTVINGLSYVAGGDEVKFLVAQKEAGKLTEDHILSFDYYFKKNQPGMLPLYRSSFGLPIPIERPVVDYAKEKVLINQRSLAALFNKEAFVKELSMIFEGMGKSELAYDDTYSNDFYSNAYLGVARDFLDLYHYGPLKLSDALTRIDNIWENGFIYRIYDFLIANKDSTLTEDQIKVMSDWCDSKIDNIDFRVSITSDEYRSWTLDTEAVMLSYFMRKLQLAHYVDEKYLDLLSFVRHSDDEQNVFDYVAARVGNDRVVTRVFENLGANISYPQVMQNHLDYISQGEIIEATPLLLPYLKNPDMGMGSDIFDVYIKLEGDLSKLEEVFDRAREYFLEHVIVMLLKTEAKFLKQGLIGKFNAEIDEKTKLNFAKHLIKLQYLPALDYYCKCVYVNGIVPDYSSPDNPLYALKTTRAVNRLLKLIEFSAADNYKHDRMRDLLTIGMTAIKNIALEHNNFGWANMQIKLYLFKMRIRFAVRKDEKLAAIVKNVKENWRMIEKFNYQDREEFPNLATVLYVFDKTEWGS